MEPVLQDIARKVGIGKYDRHVFLCVGPKTCCTREQGQESWDYLKERLNELRLAAPLGPVYRTQVNCFRICHEGPIGLIYPDGTWYHSLTPDNLERVIQEHLLHDRPVEDLLFGENPL